MTVIFRTFILLAFRVAVILYTCLYFWKGVFLSFSLIQLWGEVCKMIEECISSTTMGFNNGSVKCLGGCLWSIVRWVSYLLLCSSFILHLLLTLATSWVLIGVASQRWDGPCSHLGTAGLNGPEKTQVFTIRTFSFNLQRIYMELLRAGKRLSKWNNINKYG